MAAPVAASLILPDDSSNTGKKLRTQTRVVGSDTVHEYFARPVLGATLTGRYWVVLGTMTVLSTVQNGTTSAYSFLQNPIGSGVAVVLRRLVFDCNCNNITIAGATAPVLSVRKFTTPTNGTDTTGLGVIIPSSTSTPASKVLNLASSTGMTVTLLSEITNFQVPAIETVAMCSYVSKEAYPFNPLAFARGSDIEFAPGEGMTFYLSVAGSASDLRSVRASLVWDEFDIT